MAMIRLTSRNGSLIEVETNLLKDIQSVPETLVTTTEGAVYTVQESVEEVIAIFSQHHSQKQMFRNFSPALKVLATRERFRHDICAHNANGLLYPKSSPSILERVCLSFKNVTLAVDGLLGRTRRRKKSED